MPDQSLASIAPPTLCVVRHAHDHHAAYETAIRENPANAAITPTYESETGYYTDELQPRLLVAFNRYWARGRTLKIEFLNNPPDPITRPIMEAARKWLPHINLKFEQVSHGPGDIRIGLNEQQNWSQLGTDALLIAQDLPTMEFNVRELFTPDIKPAAELERIVLHEFGHALGAIHEHQHPDAHIPWNEPLLKAVLKQIGYSDEEIHLNWLDTYEAADFHYSPYDRDSIMHLDIPRQVTDGKFEVINIGKTLSPGDIELMRSVYPDRQNSKYGGE